MRFLAGKLEFLQHRLDPLLQFPGRQAVDPPVELEILQHAELAVERKFLGHVTDFGSCLGPGSPQILSGHAEDPAGSGQKTAEHPEGGGLAGPVGTQEPEHLSFVDFKGSMGHRREIPEFLHQIPDGDAHIILGGVRRHFVQGRQGDPFFFQVGRLVEEDHEPVFHPGRHGFGHQIPPFQGRQRRSRMGGNITHRTALGHRIDDFLLVIQQRSLEHPVRQSCRRIHFKALSRRHLAEALRSPVEQDVPLVEHIDFIAHGRLIHIGRTDNDAEMFLLDHLVDDDPQVLPGQGIHPYGGFIQEQQIRRPDQGTGQSQFLLHAPGQFPGQPSGKRGQTGHVQEFGKPGFPHVIRNTVKIRIQIHVLLDGQVFIEAEFLGHVTDPGLDFRSVFHRIQPQHLQASSRGIHQTADQTHGGGLAGSVRTDQGGHFSFFLFQIIN